MDENIRCIVAVPAIWDYKNKDIMLKASKASGLITQEDDFSHFFALEPEAASLNFSFENDEKICKLTDNKEMSFFYAIFGVELSILSLLKKFLLCLCKLLLKISSCWKFFRL